MAVAMPKEILQKVSAEVEQFAAHMQVSFRRFRVTISEQCLGMILIKSRYAFDNVEVYNNIKAAECKFRNSRKNDKILTKSDY